MAGARETAGTKEGGHPTEPLETGALRPSEEVSWLTGCWRATRPVPSNLSRNPLCVHIYSLAGPHILSTNAGKEWGWQGEWNPVTPCGQVSPQFHHEHPNWVFFPQPQRPTNSLPHSPSLQVPLPWLSHSSQTMNTTSHIHTQIQGWSQIGN